MINIGYGVWYVPNSSKCQYFDGEVDGFDETELSVVTYDNRQKTRRSISEFINEMNEWKDEDTIYVMRAYEVSGFIFLNTKPTALKFSGAGFNYGSLNIVEAKEPGFILISAEND